MEADMRIICVAFTGLVALAAVSAQIAPNPENWLPLGSALSFGLGDQGCGKGWHQALWRDWRGEWWWGLAFRIGEIAPALSVSPVRGRCNHPAASSAVSSSAAKLAPPSCGG